MNKIEPMQSPIEVTDAALSAAILALLRYLVALVVAIAVARGWLNPESAEGIGAILLAIGTTSYGIYNTWRRRSQLVTAARAAPDSVAVVKE
jgi:hypothetical protein